MIVAVPEIASEFGAESSLGQEAGIVHEIGFERMKKRFYVSVVPLERCHGSCSDEHPRPGM